MGSHLAWRQHARLPVLRALSSGTRCGQPLRRATTTAVHSAHRPKVVATPWTPRCGCRPLVVASSTQARAAGTTSSAASPDDSPPRSETPNQRSSGNGGGAAARPTGARTTTSREARGGGKSGFAKLGLHPLLSLPLAKMNIVSPTPVQDRGWRPILRNECTLLAAQTGTGKTLAYALPIVQRYIEAGPALPRFSTLCLVPTRELAVQVHQVFTSLLREVVGEKANQHVHCIVKGIETSTIKKQLRKLNREEPAIIVATPARFLELLEKHPIADEIQTVVLDEADKLLDPLSKYASEKQKQNRARHPRPTTSILDLIVYRRRFGPREDRRPYQQLAQQPQIICASASLTGRVKRELVQRGWCHPRSITTVSLTDGVSLPANVSHFVVNESVCKTFNVSYDETESAASQAENLFEQLEWTLTTLQPATALVFVPTSVPVKETTARVGSFQTAPGSPITAIAVYDHVHSARSPSDAAARRAELLRAFATATPARPIVGVCNMDAIRGLDIPDVELACIVGTPRTHVDYLHIAGRVGRGSAPGVAVLFAYDTVQAKRAENMARKLRVDLRELDPEQVQLPKQNTGGSDGQGEDRAPQQQQQQQQQGREQGQAGQEQQEQQQQ